MPASEIVGRATMRVFDSSAPAARSVLTTYSKPVLGLPAVNASAQNSALPKIAFSHLAQVPAAPQEDARQAARRAPRADRRRRSARASLRDDEVRRGGVRGEVVEQPLHVALAAAGRDREPEHLLAAVVVVAPGGTGSCRSRPRLSMPWPVRQREASITSACV